MNYKLIYDKLIQRGRTRGLNKSAFNYYTETHHIVPKSLGGSNSKSNLVLLTGREHFIAHLLLSKISNTPKMHYALWLMCICNNPEFKVHSRFYESARKIHAANISAALKGKTRTTEHRVNLSNSLKGRASPTQGKTLSSETKDKISAALTGKVQSKETRKARSDKQKGIPKPLYPPCPHCGKISSKATALRWHYDNCKGKQYGSRE
ncbi:homing endonuclease [Yersinia phage MHG19]|nr:homing endonuclease [Yersinia phage MHG19]